MLPFSYRAVLACACASALLSGCGSAATGKSGPGRGGFATPVSEPIVVSPESNESEGIGLEVLDGQMWVTTSADGTLQRFDTSTGSLVGDPIEVRKDIGGLKAAGPALWAIDYRLRELLRIDPGAGTVSATPAAGTLPTFVTAGDDLWLSQDIGMTTRDGQPDRRHRLERLDGRTGKPAGGGFTVDGFSRAQPVFGAGTFWLGDLRRGQMQRFDTAGTAVGDPIDLGGETDVVRPVGDSVYVATHRTPAPETASTIPFDGRLHLLDGQTGERLKRSPVLPGRVTGIESGGDRIWLTVEKQEGFGEGARTTGYVVRLDPRTLALDGEPIRVGSSPGDPTWAADALWIADSAEHSIRRIDPGPDGGNRAVPRTPRQKEQQELMDRAREAQKTEPSADAGCVRDARGQRQVVWVPPTPRVTARRSGKNVVVEWSFDDLGQAPVCRPFSLIVSVWASGGPEALRPMPAGQVQQEVTSSTGKVTVKPHRELEGKVKAGVSSLSIGGLRSPVAYVPVDR